MDITVLSPMAEEYLEPEAKFAGARSDSLRGKTVGILENGWTSMSALAEHLHVILTEKYGVTRVKHWVTGISLPAEAAMVDAIAADTDLTVVGLGN